MTTLDSLFDQFVRERTYLNNVTPKTQEWYRTAWKAFKRFQADAPARPTNAPLISRLDLQQFVVHLRERGIKPVSCNCWLLLANHQTLAARAATCALVVVADRPGR